jgi:hypothetical protein
MGTNQYPKDEMAAVDILTNHRFDKKNKEQQPKEKESE